jgi:pimeloyl-ACP methyl ester carboxylesterase
MYITVNNTRLFFDVEGAKLVPDGPIMHEKRTLVLLHGGPGLDHSLYKPAFSTFSDVTQVIYLDHRGQGRSEPSSPAHWKLASWADDLRAFCDALGIEHPVVFGESAGGWIAMAYATLYPDHPGKLILSSTSARRRLSRILTVFERLGGSAAREVARNFLETPNPDTLEAYLRICFPLYNRTPQDPDIIPRSRTNLEILFFFFQNEFKTMNFLPALARVQCPTLVLAGTEDPITPIEDAEDIVAALPSRLVRFERFLGSGHGVYRDDPAQGFQRIREFILSSTGT